MKEERIWYLLSLQLSGEATAEELAELNNLLQANPGFLARVNQVEALWKKDDNTAVPAINDAFDRHLQRLSNHLATPALQYQNTEDAEELPKRPFIKRRMVWMSAVAAAAVIAVVLMYPFNSREPVRRPAVAANIVTTKPGSKSKISLPDGTQVWLNADSKLTYNDQYGNQWREVELTGEAYFDVVKDKARPFIIHTRSVHIKVLGTAFNVRSYPNEKTCETSLIRGLVEVTLNNNPDKKIILKPNEKLVVHDVQAAAAAADKRPVDTVDEAPLLALSQLHYLKGDSSSIETYWTKNKLAFEGETLENAAKKIERWYGVKITITDERLKAEKYTSVFEDESLPEVMNALRLTGSFNYTINKKEVIIRP